MQLKELHLLMLTFIWLVIFMCSKNITAINTFSSIATIYVDPQESIGIIGQNFTINICISDVVDLYGWEFKLGWNATILDAVEVSEGSFLKSGGSTFFTYKINNTLGYMIVDCTLLGQVPGVSGSGVLATIKFHVKSIGECPLDLYDTVLVNSVEQAIEHISIDGYYCTSVHDIAIINLTASSTEVNVTVENQGTHTETFNVSAYYTRLSDPLIGTQTVTLIKGATTTLTFTWTPPSPGRYEIRAEATTVPEETDIADNIYTIIIQAGYSTSNFTSQTANSINGFYMVVSIFLLTSAVMLPKALNKAHRTQNYML
ncbi:MAG: cohesin domain-containing protein, partial [Fervidobacterium sp.]